MDNNEVLDRLLKIESEAAALVNDAQAKADTRIAEAEKQHRAIYEERYQNELKKMENEFQEHRERIQKKYREEMDAYREKISLVNVDTNAFRILLDRLIAEKT